LAYARGKYAFGFCDRTGFRYPLDQLVYEYKNGVKTGLRVGKDVADQDHPQNFLGRVKVFDPQALRDPRPDKFIDNAATISVNGINVSSSISSVTVSVPGTSSYSAPSILSSTTLGSIVAYQLFAVTVVDDGGNKYFLDGSNQTGSAITLNEGSTYRFDQSHSSNSGHPLRFSTTSNGTHGGGSEYTTGVTTAGTPGSSGAYTQITVAASAPTLYYYCTNHSGMGGQANTP
jgi:hypothetical protein